MLSVNRLLSDSTATISITDTDLSISFDYDVMNLGVATIAANYGLSVEDVKASIARVKAYKEG